MRTLEEYNRQYFIRLDKLSENKAGVLCSKCKGAEMIYTEPNSVLMSNPPKMKVACPKCNYKGYKYV